MIILSVDIGGTGGTGVVVYDTDKKQLVLSTTFLSRDKGEGVVDFFVEVGGIAYRYSPDLILAPLPTSYRNTIGRHHEKIGSLRVIAHHIQAELRMVLDSNCKSLILGNGSADKDHIAEHYKRKTRLKTEHERDAYMFIEANQTGKLKFKS